MERGVYFDAWYPRQHCYHPSLPPRRLRMIDDLIDYRATVLVWAALGGGSLALPYLEQEAFGAVEPRSRFYGFVNDSEFIAACRERGIKVFGIVFEAQGWEFPVELDDDESTVLALNELRGVGHRDWLGLREFSANRYPKLWPAVETYFPDGLINSRGEQVSDLIEECVARDIHGRPCHARWVECPDREHECFYMDRNNPVWRAYLQAVIRIQIDAGVDGVQLDEAELPLGALQYGACFCVDCTAGFRDHLRGLPQQQRPPELADVDLDTFAYGPWLLAQGFDFVDRQQQSPLFGEYYAFQCGAIHRYFAELADYARSYAADQGRSVQVSGNFFNLDPQYLPLADHVDLIITEMRNTTYRQPEWFRYAEAFARTTGGRSGGAPEVIVVENPYGGIVPELVELLAAGRGHDRMRLSLFEAAAFGANMTVPYGSWLGATLEDSFWAPHRLLSEAQDFLAETDDLRSARSANEVAVVYSVASMRDLVARADVGDNLLNAHDPQVVVPFRVTTEALMRAGIPIDVVLATDGRLAADRFALAELRRYRTVVLPGCRWLTEHQVTTLLAYLDGGGTVVATDETATDVDRELQGRLLAHPRYHRAAPDDPDALQPLGPQVLIGGDELAVHLQRGATEQVACHVINYGYDEREDTVRRQTEVTLQIRLPGIEPGAKVQVLRPEAPPVHVPLDRDGEHWRCVLPEIGVYAVVVFGAG